MLHLNIGLSKQTLIVSMLCLALNKRLDQSAVAVLGVVSQAVSWEICSVWSADPLPVRANAASFIFFSLLMWQLSGDAAAAV